MKMKYPAKVSRVVCLLSTLLDEELQRLASAGQKECGYYHRLQVRKRIVQSILEIAQEENWHVIKRRLQEEFLKPKYVEEQV